MILPDVNILIYAFRKDLPQHTACRSWLESVISGDAPFGLSPLTLSAVTRIVTNKRIFKTPDSPGKAFAYCDNLLNQPHSVIVEPGPGHWEIFKRLCIETDTRGARVADAWFAALAIEQGCTFITLDRDYARFPQLDWRGPDA